VIFRLLHLYEKREKGKRRWSSYSNYEPHTGANEINCKSIDFVTRSFLPQVTRLHSIIQVNWPPVLLCQLVISAIHQHCLTRRLLLQILLKTNNEHIALTFHLLSFTAFLTSHTITNSRTNKFPFHHKAYVSFVSLTTQNFVQLINAHLWTTRTFQVYIAAAT